MKDKEVIEKKAVKEKGRLYWFSKNILSALFRWCKKHWALSIIFLLCIAGFIVIGRAFYHPLILGLRKYFVLALLILFISYLFVRVFQKSGIGGKIFSALAILMVVAGGVLFGKVTYEYIGLYIHYENLNKVKLLELPLSKNERIHPRNSILTISKQEALSETEDVTRPMFIRRKSGRYDFSMCVGPSSKYLAQRLKKNMYRVLSVPATTPAPDFSDKNQIPVNFDVGEFLLFSKNSETAALKSLGLLQYLSYETGEAFFIEDNNGEWIQVVPLIRWKGIIIPRPVFGGVIVFDQLERSSVRRYFNRLLLGVGQYIPAEDIHSYNYLAGQHLLPDKVSRFIAESFRFQEGFFAPMPGYHEGDIRIPDMPEDQNEQPFITYFLIPGLNGMMCSYFGLEPYDESLRALNTSLVIPGDGDETVYYLDHSFSRAALIGSSAIPSKVIESKKNYDWSKNHPAESRPFIKNIGGMNRFFWLNTVVTNMDKTGESFIGGTIPDVTITDAKYGKVVWINDENLVDVELWEEQIRTEMKGIWERTE